MTYVNGTSYSATIDSTGKYYTTVFPGGISIAKGNSIDVYVQGDISGASAASRTVKFDIDKVTDVYFVGQTYGYGVAPSGTFSPWFSGYTVTVNAGSATSISKANEVPAQNVALNVPNQPLGGFVTDFKGESVSVSQMIVNFDYSSGAASTNLLTSVSLVNENGAVVAGPIDAVVVAGGQQKVTFTDTVTFPTGRHVYTLKGKIPSTVSNGVTITASTTPSGWSSPTGQTSGNTITISQGSFALNTMTVQAAALTVSISSQPAAQNVVAGGTGILFANVQLDASASGEDVRISSLPIRFSNVTGLSNCQLWDGSTALNTGSNVATTLSTGAANNFLFDNSITVTKGTVKTLGMKCNTTSSATGSYAVSLNGSDTISATGLTSGSSITVTNSANSGASMTVGTGSVTVTIDSSSPSYTLAAGGANGVTMGVVKFRSANEATTLTKLGLTLTSGSAAQLNTVYIYDGATQVGTATFTGSNTTATSTLTTSVTLPKDTDKTLTIKADLADIGSGQAGTDGALIKIDPNSAEGSGQASGNTLRSGATAGVAGVRVYNTFPTVALDTLGTTGVGDGRLMRFKVTADSHDQVGLGSFKFTISTTTASVTNIQLFGYTDAAYSSPVSNQGTSGQIGGTVSTATNGTAFAIAPNSNPVEVPAGSTYYFELRATVSGVTTGSSVVTTLNGDSSASPSSNTTTFAALSASNFIWSPNATGTAATTTGNDWTNGFAVPGLSSSGLIQNRSN
jgi:hypothetical protein